MDHIHLKITALSLFLKLLKQFLFSNMTTHSNNIIQMLPDSACVKLQQDRQYMQNKSKQSVVRSKSTKS